jgi:hypothetical protein
MAVRDGDGSQRCRAVRRRQEQDGSERWLALTDKDGSKRYGKKLTESIEQMSKSVPANESIEQVRQEMTVEGVNGASLCTNKTHISCPIQSRLQMSIHTS